MTITANLTRRSFVALAGAALASTWTGRALGALRRVAAARFATQPGWNLPPVTITMPAGPGVSPGYLFLAPSPLGVDTPPGSSGVLIMDNGGEPVWFLPLESVRALNFQAQVYKGKSVLTWYEGQAAGTYGGSCVIYDNTYHEVKRVHAGNGLACDGHEFIIT
ncbi:MAG TPA: hypothetical protein VGL84_09845, partial [Gaiellaceae bacterium]